MAFRWQRELPQWLLLLAMFGLAAFAWSAAPDSIPIHWGLSGEPNRFTDKTQGLLTLPIIAVVTYFGLLLVPHLVKATEAQLGGLYVWLRFGILVMLAGLYAAIVLSVLGAPIDVGRAAPALVGALLLAIGAVMGRMRPNAIMGVRTPWTLTSEASWEASHRVGGWIFMLVGVLMVLGGLTNSAWLFLAAIAALFAGMIFLVVYGWWVCKSDPRRLPRGQTLLTWRPEQPGPRQERPARRRERPARSGGRRR